MSDSVPAAAIGLPIATSFDRRSFLATLAAAGVMTGAPAALAAAEHPDAELLELVALLAEATARRADFGCRADAIYAECYQGPALVEAALWRPSDWTSVWMQTERLDTVVIAGVERFTYDTACVLSDLYGKVARWKALAPVDRICGPDDIARAEEIIAAVEAHRLQEKKAAEACGSAALDRAFEVETDAIDAIVERLIETPAQTPEGICAKARAAGIYGPHEVGTARLSASLIADAMTLGSNATAASSDRSAA